MNTDTRYCSLFALGAVLLSAGVLGAQCSDPKNPPAGFQLTVKQDQLITYTDLYRTRADVRYPSTAPGSCGWPLLIAVHGFPSSKQSVIATHSTDLARQGYFVVTYDVRGQGSAIALNPGRGTTLMGFNEWIDLFEVIEWAERTHPKLVDSGRVGVFGISQGGAHSWAAAAWSGQTPPANPRRTKAFPRVHAVAPFVMVPSHPEAATLEGTAFKANWMRHAFALPTTKLALDSATQKIWQGFLLKDDPEGNAAWMRNDPGRDFVKLLAKSTTPTLVMMTWLDVSMPANPSLSALVQMPATTPKRIYLTTGLHGTALNDYEWSQALSMRLAWFDRFLKKSGDPIEAGPPVLSAALPANKTEYLSPSTLWRHRADPQFPPAGSVTSTFYLRSAAALSPSAPTAKESPERITHSLPTGYSARSWLADGSGSPTWRALGKLPLSNHSYTTAPLTGEIEIAGIPKLHLEVTPGNARFLLAARLEVVSASGGTLIISQGGLGVRQQSGPKPATVSITLSAIDTVIPAGARLRLSVRNHFLSMSTKVESFRFMPYFSGYWVDIEHRPGAASRLELPLRPERRLDVSTKSTSILLQNPATVNFLLRSSAAHGGAPYVLVASLSGQGPPVVLPGGPLYLVPDALTTVFLGLGGPLLTGFLGVLDRNGGATASLNLAPLAPMPSQPAGTNLHLAPVALRSTGLEPGTPLTLALR